MIPGTSEWWLDHYDEFARHLDQRYRRMAARDGAFIAYDLDDRRAA